MNEKAHNELSLLGEDLNAIASTLTNIYLPIDREVNAMQSGRELHLIGRIMQGVVRGCWVVVDFAERNSVTSPAALEFAVVVIDQDSLGIDDLNLAGIFIQVEEENAPRKDIRLLIVLRGTRSRRARRAMPEIP